MVLCKTLALNQGLGGQRVHSSIKRNIARARSKVRYRLAPIFRGFKPGRKTVGKAQRPHLTRLPKQLRIRQQNNRPRGMRPLFKHQRLNTVKNAGVFCKPVGIKIINVVHSDAGKR